jgi:hypothetical protein
MQARWGLFRQKDRVACAPDRHLALLAYPDRACTRSDQERASWIGDLEIDFEARHSFVLDASSQVASDQKALKLEASDQKALKPEALNLEASAEALAARDEPGHQAWNLKAYHQKIPVQVVVLGTFVPWGQDRTCFHYPLVRFDAWVCLVAWAVACRMALQSTEVGH